MKVYHMNAQIHWLIEEDCKGNVMSEMCNVRRGSEYITIYGGLIDGECQIHKN